MTRSRSLTLHMYDDIRSAIIERHTFFVREAKNRLLNQFNDIEGEADRYLEESWEAAMRVPCYGDDPDVGSIAEAVQDAALSHYMLLDDMRMQVRLSMTAAMFHQWDKELREHLEREFRHYVNQDCIDKEIWKATTAAIFHLFEQFGWSVKAQPFFPLIDACNLIVNVYKHGKGTSLIRLHDIYPQYLSDLGIESWTGTLLLDHKWLNVTDADFNAFAGAFEAFWKEIPKQLIYNFPEEPTPA